MQIFSVFQKIYYIEWVHKQSDNFALKSAYNLLMHVNKYISIPNGLFIQA